MAQMVFCDGNLVQAAVGRDAIPGVLACDSGWVPVVYDQNAMLEQMVQINSFDPVLAAKNVSFCLLIFTIGFIVGVVIRNMRRL
jgi:hypothetical protein